MRLQYDQDEVWGAALNSAIRSSFAAPTDGPEGKWPSHGLGKACRLVSIASISSGLVPGRDIIGTNNLFDPQ
jgi:hypothetical protein